METQLERLLRTLPLELRREIARYLSCRPIETHAQLMALSAAYPHHACGGWWGWHPNEWVFAESLRSLDSVFALREISDVDFSRWDVQHITSMRRAFAGVRLSQSQWMVLQQWCWVAEVNKMFAFAWVEGRRLTTQPPPWNTRDFYQKRR